VWREEAAMKALGRSLMAGALVLACANAQARERAAPELAYQLVEGQNLNAFVREGPIAAHLLLRSSKDPRILVAFPAGNSGVGLWFEPVASPVQWRLEAPPQPLTVTDAKGRALNGVRAVASLAVPRLAPKQAVLSNVRFLRDYQSAGKFPSEVAAAMKVGAGRIGYARDRLDGAPGYLLSIRVLDGKVEPNGAILAGADGRIRMEIVAASGDPALHGIAESELLNEHAADDPAARNALRFLSYREKFLAGSWRFNTYFGRDTLMSVRMLMPVLRPTAVEAGLNSVLARLNDGGEVAHEEGISEFAIVENRRHGGSGDAAVLDYGMIDDDFMLAPVMANYLLDTNNSAAARAYLAREVPSIAKPGTTERVGAALIRNLRYILAQAKPFAHAPGFERLIAIKPGRMTGDWRDSEEGLGRGRYPYDVNAALVPAALDAARRMFEAGVLDRYLSAGDREALRQAGDMAQVWRTRAPEMFRVSVPTATAASAVRAYASSIGVPAEPAIGALGGDPLVFHAISLDAQGAPVPIVNSDEGFVLLFDNPTPAELDTYVTAIMRPFPAGLLTPVGLLTANPAQAAPDVQARFRPGDYHGTDVWSWQQALLAAGLERQLARPGLPDTTRARLKDAQTRLWRVILATRKIANSELWSWAYEDGQYRVVPFGAGRNDVDESNAAQLWSTVYLAVQPPPSTRRREMQ
jgi:hypothetical protein